MMDELRMTAANWHSGQGSPLYAFASSGTVVPGATREAKQCLSYVRGSREGDRLRKLVAYFEENEPIEDEEEE